MGSLGDSTDIPQIVFELPALRNRGRLQQIGTRDAQGHRVITTTGQVRVPRDIAKRHTRPGALSTHVAARRGSTRRQPQTGSSAWYRWRREPAQEFVEIGGHLHPDRRGGSPHCGAGGATWPRGLWTSGWVGRTRVARAPAVCRRPGAGGGSSRKRGATGRGDRGQGEARPMSGLEIAPRHNRWHTAHPSTRTSLSQNPATPTRAAPSLQQALTQRPCSRGYAVGRGSEALGRAVRLDQCVVVALVGGEEADDARSERGAPERPGEADTPEGEDPPSEATSQ